MKKRKLFTGLIVMCSLIIGVPVQASTISNEDSSNVSMQTGNNVTMGDIEEDVKEYLSVNNPNMQFGSQEFVNYSMNVLMENSDKKLAELQNYDDIRYYLGEYLYQLDQYQAAGNEVKGVFDLSDSYKAETKDEIQRQAIITENQENSLYQSSRNSSDGLLKSNSYNASSAVNYAVRYANSYNSQYDSYFKDCTNFVSQALHAGGISMRNPSYVREGITNTTSYWYSIRYEEWHTNNYVYRWKTSTSWINVDALYSYSVKHGAAVYTYNSLSGIQNNARIGDVVQLKNAKGNWYHSIIITGGTRGNYTYCGHTTSRKNYPLKLIKDNDTSYRIIRF